MMKKLVVLIMCALVAGAAYAEYYVRGDYNGWDLSTPMNDDGDGTYSALVTGLTPGYRFEFKVAVEDWSSSWPGSNAKTIVDPSGEVTFHFTPGAVSDGWNPSENRVGYDDPGQFGWEIMGAFNGWDAGIDTVARQMVDEGGGMYSVMYNIAAAGSYEYKFRESGSWDISIGGDFGNSAGNNTIVTASDNTLVLFELDLPNGRWNATIVPEPATMTLFGLGFLLTSIRRRK